jgi:hypothetical protein
MSDQFELQFQGELKQFSTSVLDHREEFGELIANIFGIQFGYLQDKQEKVVSLRDVKPGHTYTAFPKGNFHLSFFFSTISFFSSFVRWGLLFC